MARKLIPLVLVMPAGVLVGIWANSASWSSTTRVVVTGALALLLVLIGTPLALLRRRTPLPPRVGEALAAGWQLRGVYSEFPVGPLPRELAERFSDLTLLLPVVRPDIERLHGAAAHFDIGELERATDRVLLLSLSVDDEHAYYGRLPDIPNDVTIWPGRRRRSLHRLPGRAVRRVLSWPRNGEDARFSDNPLDRVIDHPAV